MKAWFRHYVGMTRDDKLMSVAAKSRQPLDRVLYVWIAILESASECENSGRYDVDPEMVAYNIRCEPSDVTAIMLALEVAGRLSNGVVCQWSARQFESDSSRDRMRRHRNRQNGGGNGQKPHSDAPKNHSDNDVLDGDVTVTAPDTDTDKKEDPVLTNGRQAAELIDDAAVEILGPDPAMDAEANLYRTGKQLLGKSSGGLITKLLKAHNGNFSAAQERVDRAFKVGGDPKAFIAGCVQAATTGPPQRPKRVDESAEAVSHLLSELRGNASH